jgi:hypothetical protein
MNDIQILIHHELLIILCFKEALMMNEDIFMKIYLYTLVLRILNLKKEHCYLVEKIYIGKRIIFN